MEVLTGTERTQIIIMAFSQVEGPDNITIISLDSNFSELEAFSGSSLAVRETSFDTKSVNTGVGYNDNFPDIYSQLSDYASQ